MRPMSGLVKTNVATGLVLPNESQDVAVRILVTDDQPEMLDLMNLALGSSFECEFASDMEQAHEKLASGTFQLVICNIDAAGETGLALAEEIVEEYPETATVVLMTGDDDPEAARQAFAIGVFGYLVEPFWPGQLLITVMSALRRRELEMIEKAHSQNLKDQRQTIIDMAPMPIYAKDASYRYVVANTKADDLAGLERGELIGLTDEAIMPPDGARIANGIDRRIFEEGTIYEADEIVEVGGVERTFKTVKFPLLGEEGQITAVGGISADITAENESIRLSEELAANQQKAIEELQLSRQETIEGLAKAISLHDSATGEHVDRMAAIAAFLGGMLNLDPGRVQLLRAAAPMHDVGKIGIRAEILRKAGPLSTEERKEMERHTVIGHGIFAHFQSDLSRMAASIALTHHERYDGGGYPQGLVGEQIPLEGRIVAIADVFDALLSDRSYRLALPLDDAVAVIRDGRGTHFDSRIADVLLIHLDEALSCRG